MGELRDLETQISAINAQLNPNGRRRLGATARPRQRLNLGRAFQLRINLANLERRKQQIVADMARNPLANYADMRNDQRSSELRDLETQISAINAQLNPNGRRRLGATARPRQRLNLGRAFQLRINLANLERRKQQIVA